MKNYIEINLQGRALKLLLAALFVFASIAVTLAPPAQAKLSKAGPINPESGYPYWYEDANGTRLDLCLDPQDQMCLQPFEMPNPAAPVSFPTNFPAEAFWWAGDAETTVNDINGEGDALLVMAQEAAFANEEPKAGDQMSFGRVRVRIDNLEVGKTYRVTHPYGVDTYVAEDDGKGFGEINVTEDIGCFPAPGAPCNFDEARFGRVGPFLAWDTFGTNSPDAPPAGYVGNPGVAHKVKGSPYNTNFFKVEKQNADGTFQQIGQTERFNVSGKATQFKARASVQGGVYNAPQTVTFSGSEPGMRYVYTTDGSVPAVDTTTGKILNGAEYTGPLTISETTTLKFIGVNVNTPSRVFTEVYTIDTVAPTVSASVAPGDYDTAQTVELTSEPGAKIYYTLNGSEPTTASNLYDAPIQVFKPTTIKAIAVDAAGNRSAVSTYTYNVSVPASGLSLKANPPTITFGEATRLSGQFTTADPAVSTAGKTVSLQRRPAGATGWSDVAGATDVTGADGSYAFAGVDPRATTDYRARFAGDSNLQPAVSPGRTVSVKAGLSLNLSAAGVEQGRPLVISGAVRPAHTGSVTVVIRRADTDAVVASQTVRLRDSAYRWTFQPRAAVRHTVTVSFAGDADHEANTASDSFRVTPKP